MLIKALFLYLSIVGTDRINKTPRAIEESQGDTEGDDVMSSRETRRRGR
jgi:hypothetical protein